MDLDFWLIDWDGGRANIATVGSVDDGRQLWASLASHRGMNPHSFEIQTQEGAVLYHGDYETDEC